jgi:predicted aldo/keto reductase-like oxidoreductase
MPCPFGVNIPMCFSLYNDYHISTSSMITRGMYGGMLMGGIGGAPRADASLCHNCGKCALACPQKIAIPSELKKVNSTLGGLRTKLLMPIVRMMFSSEIKE